ncbi:glycosyltransferase family 4 protein [Patescibacteria group bacterium]|nr:glycosyltransferase family 4 protein [Patescibacteria group bacterium]
MKLALFFTRGASLKLWKETGNLDREIKPYKRLLDRFEKIYFLTYGKNESSLGNIKVLPVSPFRKELKDVDIFKTNQMSGSWNAVIAKKIFKKKLVIRQGRQWSIFAKEEEKTWKRPIIYLIEKFAYKNADAVMISSKADIDYIIKKYKTNPALLHYVPNYIDTDLFKPMKIEKENRIITVAKLENQKNLQNLIEAVRGLDIKLIIFGSGSLHKELKILAPVNVEIRNNISNNDLPEEINKSKLFILPSFYEGCPKALLEAMACGVPVIATNVTGIKEIIKDNQNGYLCGTSIESIKEKIKEVLANESPVNGRKTIIENFGLEKSLEREIEIYNQI